MPFPPAHPGLLQALADRGYAEPTPVQAAVLEPAVADHDLLVSAQTGSGKTVAFGLAMAGRLLGEAARVPHGSPPRALVIAPTRELAFQVERELGWLYQKTGTRVLACVGGMDPRREQRALALGAPIVVGTPGRLRDHLERKNLRLDQIEVVVLDEADEMLDLGFRAELEALLDATPPARRTLMFSATIPKGIVALAKRYQKAAIRIATTSEELQHGDIEYRAIVVTPRERELAVVNLLRYFEVTGALVFCGTREGVSHLAANLSERGFQVVALSGELSQAERSRALQSLRDGRARVCVATDVAARGLDLPDLGLVIHAELPRDRQALLHRSGRTGRAGRKGVAVVVVPAPATHLAERLFAAANIEATWSDAPSAEQIRARDEQRLVDEISSVAASAGIDELTAAQSLLGAISAEAVAAALIRMHRAVRPAAEEISPVAPRRRPQDTRPSRDARPGRDARPDRDGSAGARPEELGGHLAAARHALGDDANSVWFRLDVGRIGNADPRWLIPLLCKRGGITKAAIGAIRIQPRQTLVEISAAAAPDFARAIARTAATGGRDRQVRIQRFDPDRKPPSRR